MIHNLGFLAVTLIAAVAGAPPKVSTEEAAVLRADREFGAAVAANDAPAIEVLTTDDWQIIDGDGHIIPRARFLQVIVSGALKHSALASIDENVRVYGDSAVVTARAKSAGSYGGHAFSTDEVSTDFWVRTKDGWKCVLTQLTTRKP